MGYLDDDDERSASWLPGGPRPLGCSQAYGSARGGGRARVVSDQRMDKRDLARMGMVMSAEAGKSILEIVEQVARGEVQLSSQRLQAAIAALPYRHPRLMNSTVKTIEPFKGWTAEQLEAAAELLEQHPELAERIARAGGAAPGGDEA